MRRRYFGLRHGESEANAGGIVLSDPRAGVRGYGITQQGREQVRASALAWDLPDPAALTVFSSDFLRARESADELCLALGLPPATLDLRLRERFFGDFEGQSNAGYETVWARDREDPAQRRDGVESVRDVAARLADLLADLDAEGAAGSPVLLVSHGDPLQILASCLLARDPARHRELDPWQPGELRPLEEKTTAPELR